MEFVLICYVSQVQSGTKVKIAMATQVRASWRVGLDVRGIVGYE